MTSESPDGTLLVDFAGLAAGDPDFDKIFSAGGGYINFQYPKTVQQLTKSVLKRHFKLKVELPDDRLCPPVPVRYEYIKWLQSLLDTTSPSYSTTPSPSRPITGIDIGTGSSAIYPLLGCSTRPSWNFIGTELDSKSFSYATQNVEANDLSSRIRLHKVSSPTDPLIPLDAIGLDRVDFTMCNPPFFTSTTDMTATHLTKSRSPSAICSGAPVEMIYDAGNSGGSGGDLGFVMHMLDESMVLRERVQWYTSMLGKLASATALVQALKERGVSNWVVTSLQAGNVTRRWVVGWSFGDRRARNDVARRNMSSRDKAILPFPTEFVIALSPSTARDDIVAAVQKELSGLAVQWTYDPHTSSGLCFAAENVWSRSARRKRRKPDHDGTEPMETESSGKKVKTNEPEDIMATTAALIPPATSALVPNTIPKHDAPGHPESRQEAEDAAKDDNDAERTSAKVGIRIKVEAECVRLEWLKGQDSVLWESFCGMLKRAIDTVGCGGSGDRDGGGASMGKQRDGKSGHS